MSNVHVLAPFALKTNAEIRAELLADIVAPDATYRACPHCGGRNTGYVEFGDSCWFITRIKRASNGISSIILYACGNKNRDGCPHIKSK